MFFNFLTFVLSLVAILVVGVQNPVHSVFFLILLFILSAFLLFSLEIEFLSLLFILLYVGAIAVLFLFVVMMLDIKNRKYEKNFNLRIFLPFLIVIFLFFQLFSNREETFTYSIFLGESLEYTNWLHEVEKLGNIEVLGQLLYTYYFVYFLQAGILLLLPMLGAIVLTLNISEKKKENLFLKEVLRKKKNSYYILK